MHLTPAQRPKCVAGNSLLNFCAGMHSSPGVANLPILGRLHDHEPHARVIQVSLVKSENECCICAVTGKFWRKQERENDKAFLTSRLCAAENKNLLAIEHPSPRERSSRSL